MIRPLVRDDIPFIVRSLQQMRTESRTGQESVDDPEYVTGNLNCMFDSPYFFGFVYGTDLTPNLGTDNAQGFMFGTACPLWFCARVRAYEQSLYVKPEYRGGRAAIQLIKAFKEECIRRNAIEIYAGGYTDIKVEKLFKLYERMGFERHGTGVIYKVQ